MSRDVWGNYVTPEEFEAAAERGICRQTVKNRIALGWKAKDAVSVPVMKTSEEYKRFRAMAVSNGIAEGTFKRRVQRGWTLEEAANSPLVSQKESIMRSQKARKKVIPEPSVKAAAENGVCYSTLYSRLRCGIPMSEAVSVPPKGWQHPWKKAESDRIKLIMQNNCDVRSGAMAGVGVGQFRQNRTSATEREALRCCEMANNSFQNGNS